MKKTLLTTCNAKYIHKNLALRWLYVTCPSQQDVMLKEYVIKDDICKIVQEIVESDFEVICFSCYIWNIEQIKQIVKELKTEKPSLHIVLGGPEVSYESFDLIDQGVDAICIGEGEKCIWEYVAMLDANEPYEVKGMYTKAFPNTEYQRVPISWLESFENPYFLDMDKKSMKNRYLYLETSRGCPYSCAYCLSSADRCVRMFSEPYVIELLSKIAKSEVTQVKFLDRTFNSDPKRALRIARYINEHCVNQIFQFEVVAETLSEDLLNFFTKEADVSRFRFEVGVQSFNSTTLKSVGRIQNNARLQEVIARMRKANCILHVDLIAGLPYEGMDSFHQSFNSLFDLKASELQLGILKLLKGTRLKKESKQYNLVAKAHAPYDVISTNWLTKEELLALHACADAVEKFWNSSFASDAISIMLDLHWFQDPFTLFLALGQEYLKLPRPYQPHQLLSCFYPITMDHAKEEVDAILLMSYYKRFKQKPHRFTDVWLNADQKKKIMNALLENGIANQKELFCYGLLDVAYSDHEFGYQLVLYNTKQTLPKRWFINQSFNTIKEI